VIGSPVLADIELDAPTVLLQWAVGGLFFLWVTTRRREVGLGYGWLLRGTYALLAAGALAIGIAFDTVPVRELGSAGVMCAAIVALVVSVRRRAEQRFDRSRTEFAPALDLVAPIVGVVGLVAAGTNAGDPAALSIARAIVGAAFLGAVTDAMLLGHWYLVQPGLPRAPILELVRWTAVTWPFELLVLLLPTGMFSVLSGSIDDGYNGLLGWFWAASSLATIILVGVTRAALRERQYSAVMAATGLLYLAILMAFGMDLVARAVLS
jgi:hypothetical protein